MREDGPERPRVAVIVKDMSEANASTKSPRRGAELLRYPAQPAEALSAEVPLVSEPGHGAALVAQDREVRKGNPLVLRRPLADPLERDLRGLLASGHRKRNVTLTGEEDQLDELVAGLPEPPRSWLRADVAALADALRRLSGSRELLASLYVANHDHCRKFHVDSLGLRLLVSYAGPGTQLVIDQEAARRLLAKARELPLEEFNAAVIRAGGGIRQVEAGDVVLLRGNAGPGVRGRGVVHRSPPIARAGLRRLLLKLDVPLSRSRPGRR